MVDINYIKDLIGGDLPKDKRFEKYILKEYILLEVLDFLSRSSYVSHLTFIGGTALRLAYNINRFSEDLDFDCKELSKEDFLAMTDEVVTYLRRGGYEVETRDRENSNLKAYRRNILFPGMLYNEGLSPHRDARFLLKIEAEDQGVPYDTEKRIISGAGFYFPITLPSIDVLCAMKVSAFLHRAKGRDIYDLMFLLGKTTPDMHFLAQKEGITTEEELWEAINDKLTEIDLELKAQDFQHLLFNSSQSLRLLQFKDIAHLELEKARKGKEKKRGMKL